MQSSNSRRVWQSLKSPSQRPRMPKNYAGSKNLQVGNKLIY